MIEIATDIVFILSLILLNGLFAMSEIAIVSARRIRLEQMAQTGSRGAQAALELAHNPNLLLSTVQVGITLIGILAGAFGGATLAGKLGEVLARGPLPASSASAVSLALVVGTITFLTVVVGELVPKRIALASAERIAVAMARPMQLLSRVANPVVRLLSATTDAMLRVLGIRASPKGAVTEEEIRIMIEEGALAGSIEEVEKEMVESVFRLNDRPLQAMMTPRPEIIWLDVNAPPEELLPLIQESAHSRFPVCDGDLDHVLGVVRAKELLAHYIEDHTFEIKNLIRDAMFVPETMLALTALERFKKSGKHMALLIDEYGGVEGLATLIDILEAIVGDIPTPEEIIEPPIVERGDGSWLVDGLISVDDFKAAFNIRTLPGEGDYQTLGGFVVFMVGSVPTTGAVFGWGGFRFEVSDMDGRRVDKVMVDATPKSRDEATVGITG